MRLQKGFQPTFVIDVLPLLNSSIYHYDQKNIQAKKPRVQTFSKKKKKKHFTDL